MENAKSSYVRVYLASFTGSMAMFCLGMSAGWPSPTLPKLMAEDSPVRITPDEGSWIVSLMLLCTLFGPLLSTILVNKIGRKTTLLLSAIPYATGWILILVANSVATLYISRVISGVGAGMAFAVTPMYLGEIAPVAVRGSIGIIMVVMKNLGYVFVYAVGPYVTIPVFAGIAMAIPLIFVVIFIWFPESPYYLIYKNRPEDAMKSLQRLRGYENVKSELDHMQLSVQTDLQNSASFKQLIQSRGNRKALLVVGGIAACQQLSGSAAILSYGETIFQSAGGSLGGSESTIILGAIQLVAAVVASSVVDKLGRRPLLLVSTCGTAVTTAAVGTYFYLKDNLNSDVSNISWLPLTALIIFLITYSFGLATVIFSVVGEIFPINLKAMASGFNTILISLFAFSVTKLYHEIDVRWGLYSAFWMFSGCMIASTVFIYVVVPETKGKSFIQIQAELNGEKYDCKE